MHSRRVVLLFGRQGRGALQRGIHQAAGRRGWGDAGTFSKEFRRHWGRSPLAWRGSRDG